jgi:predicted nuclease of predicted toxin-antitoxin system
MRLLLDAHFDPAVAQALRERDHDVASIQEFGPDVYQATDAELLAYASAEGRVFVTRNVRDFIRLNAVWSAQERAHAGIVLVHAKTIPEGDRGAEIRAMETLLEAYPESADLEDTVLWLQSPK